MSEKVWSKQELWALFARAELAADKARERSKVIDRDTYVLAYMRDELLGDKS